MSDWAQYPDSTLRETYPAMPAKGGNPNKEATEGIVGIIANAHATSVQQEAAFRARQYQRRLLTRGAAAMRTPEEQLPQPDLEIPDDPELDEFKAAGWL